MKIIGTVCFIVQSNQVLLAEIEYPDGKRLWNGIGGVAESGESPEETAARGISRTPPNHCTFNFSHVFGV